MSKDERPIDSRINPGSTPDKTSDDSPTSDPINEIFYNIFETRAELNKKHKKKSYYGIILDTSAITGRDCYIETSKTFLSTIDPDYFPKQENKEDLNVQDRLENEYIDKVLFEEDTPAAASQVESKKTPEESVAETKRIYKVVVYIPEMMGFLPMLSSKEVKEYQTLKSGKPVTEEQKRKLQYYKRVISRIPAFYGKSASPPAPLKKARVEFDDENYLFYGRFLGLMG